MILDYHMHLEKDDHLDKCPYTVARIQLYVDCARARGTDEIGISEHCNRFSDFRPVMRHLLQEEERHVDALAWLHRSFKEDLQTYVDTLLEAKHEGLPVKASIEVDYLPRFEEEIREITRRFPFDYILGSVHFLGTWGIDIGPEVGWPDADVDRAYHDYFGSLRDAAGSGLFDILSHPDLIKKFGHRPSFSLDDVYDETAKAAKQADIAIEISSAGLHKPVGELYPTEDLLARFFDRGVPITLGSDAHQPERVSQDLDRAVAAAAAAGYRTVSTFDGRRRTQKPLG